MTEIELLNEEVFCLKYELNLFSTAVYQHKLERWLPNFSYAQTEKEHLQRYEWVAQRVAGKNVLDIACGAGKGSWLLAEQGKAGQVEGVDIESDAIRYAQFRHAHPRVRFQQGDATAFSRPQQYDVIVSFETIEHIADFGLMLEKMRDNLKSDGIFVVSTPISAQNLDKNPRNPYHIREWGFRTFQEEVALYFNIEEILLQIYPILPKRTLFHRIWNKITPPQYKPIWEAQLQTLPVSQSIEKELGRRIQGYQILVCTPKTHGK